MDHTRMRFRIWATVVAGALACLVTQAFPAQAEDRLQGDIKGLKAAVATLEKQVIFLHAQLLATNKAISQLVAQQVAIQNAVDLGQYVHVETGTINGLAGPHVIFTGVNVHIRDGSGQTDDGDPFVGGPTTGLGNLVIGYNEVTLADNGLQPGDRHGSHNLIIGAGHKYSSFGGFVAGINNSIIAPEASVSGGSDNVAGGQASSVSGGFRVTTPGLFDWAAGTLHSP